MGETDKEPSTPTAMFPERGDKTTRLEAFVDAAFAFAVTLLVISGDHLPRSVDDLILALKNVPTFAASFWLILVFWTTHADWSRRYGLDDAVTRRLSLLLVFLVLIFVYPLRMVFSSLFALVTDDWLPTSFTIHTWHDISALFVTYGIAYGALCAVMWLLYRHAWNCRVALGLSQEEDIANRMKQFRWAVLGSVAIVSVLAALLTLTVGSDSWGWKLGLPGFVYWATAFLGPFSRRYERKLRAQDALP
ncbi:MAG TPA: TMEM175 family protein [Xanthomonadaceae bacterium]|nr:TMEM175 family protein [Xanthomonadaceae bacterium]